MPYSTIKKYFPRKKNNLLQILNLVLIVIAIPVILISTICILLFYSFLWLRSFFYEDKTEYDQYHAELELVVNDHVKITLVEQESDNELTRLNEEWMKQVSSEQNGLYRVETVPVIPGLHHQICCFYLKETEEGVLLQLVDNVGTNVTKLNTTLVMLRFPGLQLIPIADAGPYFLYNDPKHPHLINGFNEKEKIEIVLVKE